MTRWRPAAIAPAPPESDAFEIAGSLRILVLLLALALAAWPARPPLLATFEHEATSLEVEAGKRRSLDDHHLRRQGDAAVDNLGKGTCEHG